MPLSSWNEVVSFSSWHAFVSLMLRVHLPNLFFIFIHTFAKDLCRMSFEQAFRVTVICSREFSVLDPNIIFLS